jgi:amino acid transporter
MVGGGVFALLGGAGEIAGAAVWLSFLVAAAIAGLQCLSFAWLGARYLTAGGCSSTWGKDSAIMSCLGSRPYSR